MLGKFEGNSELSARVYLPARDFDRNFTYKSRSTTARDSKEPSMSVLLLLFMSVLPAPRP